MAAAVQQGALEVFPLMLGAGAELAALNAAGAEG